MLRIIFKCKKSTTFQDLSCETLCCCSLLVVWRSGNIVGHSKLLYNWPG